MFSHHYPDVEAILGIEPEELGGVVLAYLTTADRSEMTPGNFASPHAVANYPPGRQQDARRALIEAWMWLQREGFLAIEPDHNNWYYITKRGHAAANADSFAAHRSASLLPRGALHPVIAEKVWGTFLRGDYDTSVFQSFKELEIAVRRAGRFTQTDIGMDLMRKAFRPESDKMLAGPLTDTRLPRGEQEALQHLMAGAIGSYKNPSSHRAVEITASEAVEMIVLASHLLGIVDRRVPATVTDDKSDQDP